MKVTYMLLLATGIVFAMHKTAFAKEFPTVGSVVSDLESTYLEYSCKKSESLEIKCSFIQTSVRKPSKEDVYKILNLSYLNVKLNYQIMKK